MLIVDCPKSKETLLSLTIKGTSWVWIANYIRDLLWQNGWVGNRVVAENERVLTDV